MRIRKISIRELNSVGAVTSKLKTGWYPKKILVRKSAVILAIKVQINKRGEKTYAILQEQI